MLLSQTQSAAVLGTKHTQRAQADSHNLQQQQLRTAFQRLTQPGPRTLQVLILLALLLMWAWFVLTFPPAAHWTAACALLLNQLADSGRIVYSSHLEGVSSDQPHEGTKVGGLQRT